MPTPVVGPWTPALSTNGTAVDDVPGRPLMELFRDRDDAGLQLALVLAAYHFDSPLILAIPRGGVPVAARIAAALHGELGVVVARKLRAPGQPELALGAVAGDAPPFLDPRVAAAAGAGEGYVARELAFQRDEVRRGERAYAPVSRLPVAGRTVVVVDDGVATGATMIAAARWLRIAGAARIVLAVPVGPPETISRLRAEADDVVCLQVDAMFHATGQYYADFAPVPATVVERLLDNARRDRPPPR